MIHQTMIHQMKDEQKRGDFFDKVEVPSGKRILKRKGILCVRISLNSET